VHGGIIPARSVWESAANPDNTVQTPAGVRNIRSIHGFIAAFVYNRAALFSSESVLIA
jgi:hypothetical protein